MIRDVEHQQLERLQALHVRLKTTNPYVTMLGGGPLDPPDVSKEFVDRLGVLTPTQRRLALTKACVQPWRHDPNGPPACYRRDLEHAEYEAANEHLTCGSGSVSFEVDELFSEEPEPISRLLLEELAAMTGVDRRSSFAFVISNSWSGQPPEEWRPRIEAGEIEWPSTEEPPEWVLRDFDRWSGESSEEYRRQHGSPAS